MIAVSMLAVKLTSVDMESINQGSSLIAHFHQIQSE
jgi:hypothetical protein